MIVILFLGAATGAILGFRHLKVWALTPLIVFTAVGVVAYGVAIGVDGRSMMFGLLAAVVFPQAAYLMSFIRSLLKPQQRRSDRKRGFTMGSREQDLLLSNHKNRIYNRVTLAGRRLEGDTAAQPDAANVVTNPLAPNQEHPAVSALDAVSCS